MNQCQVNACLPFHHAEEPDKQLDKQMADVERIFEELESKLTKTLEGIVKGAIVPELIEGGRMAGC